MRMDRKERLSLTSVVDRVLCPREVVELGGPYLDRRSTGARLRPAGWQRCLSSHLAIRWRRRDGFGVHDLSLCVLPEAPDTIGRLESRFLSSNMCAVGRSVLLCLDPGSEWDWDGLLADVGYARDARATSRLVRRLARDRHAPGGEFAVYRSLSWGVPLEAKV